MEGPGRIVQPILRQESACRWPQCSDNKPPAVLFGQSGQLTELRSGGDHPPARHTTSESCVFKGDVVSLKKKKKKEKGLNDPLTTPPPPQLSSVCREPHVYFHAASPDRVDNPAVVYEGPFRTTSSSSSSPLPSL